MVEGERDVEQDENRKVIGPVLRIDRKEPPLPVPAIQAVLSDTRRLLRRISDRTQHLFVRRLQFSSPQKQLY